MITKEVLHGRFRKYFRLELPATLDAVKAAFRRAARELHTDVSGRDSAIEFSEMVEAYQAVMNTAFGDCLSSNGTGAAWVKSTTTDSTPLRELGLGLGPTINGKDCPKCNHDGYTTEFGTEFTECNTCDAYGEIPASYTCRSCKGTGKFQQRNTRRIVDCRVCKGTGTFKHPSQMVYCPRCRGSKRVYGKSDTTYYVRCYECKGTGEIEVFNVVLPKGALTFGKR